MVPRSVAICQTPTWQRELAAAYRRPTELIADLGLQPSDIPDLDPDPSGFRMLVPRSFARRMIPRDPRDPLLRQVLPLGAERRSVPGFTRDPVGDAAASRGDGLLRKYAGRALLIVTGGCAVHCRYCFRRHFPYSSLGPADDRTRAALERIRADPEISEVILSGGDPLLLDDERIAELVETLAGIAHVERLRIHTRIPVVLPTRVTDSLGRALAGKRSTLVVIHANHPNEIGEDAERALQQLRRFGLHLLNQSVLLAGVNDSVATLRRLCERLFECGTLPYYLHQLDPVEGAAHFEVSDHRASGLIEALRLELPGYLVPRLVREVPGAGAKRPLLDPGISDPD